MEIPNNIELYKLLQILPGISDVHLMEHKYKDSSQVYMIFFNIKDTDAGLFILTRCIDKRYFIYGDNCSITITTGESMKYENNRPIIYVLTITQENCYIKTDIITKKLVDDMMYYIQNESFLKTFKIDYDIIYNNYINLERIHKINYIKLLQSIKNQDGMSLLK